MTPQTQPTHPWRSQKCTRRMIRKFVVFTHKKVKKFVPDGKLEGETRWDQTILEEVSTHFCKLKRLRADRGAWKDCEIVMQFFYDTIICNLPLGIVKDLSAKFHLWLRPIKSFLQIAPLVSRCDASFIAVANEWGSSWSLGSYRPELLHFLLLLFWHFITRNKIILAKCDKFEFQIAGKSRF